MKRLLLFVVALLALALIVAAPFLLRLDKYRSQIADSLSRRLNHKVIIGRIDPAFFPPAILLKDVSLMNPAGDAALLQAELITAPLSLTGLLHGALQPQSLTFQGWTVHLNRKKDGGWAYEEWLVPAARLSDSAGWPIKLVTWARGECHLLDTFRTTPDDFVIQILQGAWEPSRQYASVNGTFTSLPAPVGFLFQGSGHFLASPQWTGVLTLTDENRQWKVDCKVGAARTEASGHADQWRFDSAYALLRFYARLPVPQPAANPTVLLQNWENHFDWQGSTLSYTQSATVDGGRAEATGSVRFAPSFPSAQLDLAIKEVKLQPLGAFLFGSTALEGTATGLAHFEMVLSSDVFRGLSGRGVVELKDGRYFWPEVSGRSLKKAHTMRYLQRKYPNFLQGGLPFTKATVRWQARHGLFFFDDGFCNLGDVQVALVGAFDVPHNGIDVYARVQVREKNADLLKELPATYLYKGEGKTTIQPMNGRVQGAPGEWQLRAIRGSKIPSGVSAKLSKAIRSK